MGIYSFGVNLANETKNTKSQVTNLQIETGNLNYQLSSLVGHQNLEVLADRLELNVIIKPSFLKTTSLAQIPR